jgi:hypothetical protein
MSEYFNRLDKDLERQPMPSEYEKYISHIFCNDCEKKSPAKYHFFYHKCSHCNSYNTTVLRTENTEDTLQNNDDKGPSTSTSGESSSTEALGLSSNSDQERVMQPQAGSAAGNTNIAFSNNPRNQPPPPSSSSSSRARSGAESNEG